MLLAERVSALAALGSLDVRGLSADSRTTQPGDVFFSIPGVGSDADGLAHMAEAVSKGAVAIVGTRDAQQKVPTVVVQDVRAVLAAAAREVYSLGASTPKYAGVTGTNGKTTTTYVFEAIGKAAGARVGLLGTIEQRLGDKTWPSTHTTLETLPLAQRLVEMRRMGADWAVMEVSSHGLHFRRADAVRFDVAAFSNLTPDHLDLHGSMDAYGDTKARLFSELLTPSGTAVLNVDGAGAPRMRAAVRSDSKTLFVGRGGVAGTDVRLISFESRLSGLHLDVATPLGKLELASELIGDYNLDNLMLGCGMAIAAGFTKQQIERGVDRLHRVPGRLSRVAARDGRSAFVDYAHTPDALVRVLETLRPLTKGKIICVFGCGGDRDKSKRSLMGQAVARGSDIAIVTSDNPRSENPTSIIDDIMPGMSAMSPHEGKASRGWLRIEDRGEAIARAVKLQRETDVVVVAGKGHETYQIVGAETRHFDDLEELQKAYGDRPK